MLTQGVLMGIVMGLLQFPAFAAVSQYFDKKRATALGVVVSGSSIGGVVIPIALSKMLNSSSLGFGWSVRVIGFVIIPLMIFSCMAVKSRLPPRTTTFFIGAAFKEARYILLIVALFFMFLGMFTPLFFIPTYAVTRGIDATLASYLLAIVNTTSTFGRIIPGVLADKYGRLNILALGGIMTGIVIFCLNKAETTAALVVYSVAFGFFFGDHNLWSFRSLCLCLKDPRDIGTYMGMGMAVSSLAALIGPPVNGVLVDRYGGFLQVSIFSGVKCLVGGCTVLVSKVTTPQGILGNT
jgi:MFS family permease